jgi:hypothetical protein
MTLSQRTSIATLVVCRGLAAAKTHLRLLPNGLSEIQKFCDFADQVAPFCKEGQLTARGVALINS